MDRSCYRRRSIFGCSVALCPDFLAADAAADAASDRDPGFVSIGPCMRSTNAWMILSSSRRALCKSTRCAGYHRACGTECIREPLGALSISGALLRGVDRSVIARRFLVNSTLGVAGVFDPATPLGLPDVQEDIGQALEVWGFDQSPYLVLPFVGLTLVQVPDRAPARGYPRP